MRRGMAETNKLQRAHPEVSANAHAPARPFQTNDKTAYTRSLSIDLPPSTHSLTHLG